MSTPPQSDRRDSPPAVPPPNEPTTPTTPEPRIAVPEQAATRVASRPASGSVAGGKLPAWAPWGAPVAAAVVVGVLMLIAGFNIAGFLVLSALVGAVVLYGWSRAVEGPRRATDRLVSYMVTTVFVAALAPLVSLLVTVVRRGATRFDAGFFTESMRGVIGEGGGALHAIFGTLIITGCATLISVPIGILAAIYLQEYGKGRLRHALTFFVDVMTGIPSIVAGLFAYSLFAIFYGPGVRLGIMAAVALSVLMIPIVVRSTEEMLRIVPNGLREAAYALGVSKARTIIKVVLPTALGGIVTGVMLAIARIIGETAPLLITAGVVSSVNTNPFDGRMANLAVFAFNSYKSPGVPPEPSIDRAWTAALVLILIVMILNVGARLVYRRFGAALR
jgi:phosphate transport system permease protein